MEASKETKRVNDPREIMNKLYSFGYNLKYQDGTRFIEMYKDFGNSDSAVNGGDELQVGRGIEIYDGKIYIKPFMKRGCLWASSAEIQKSKGNIYTYANGRLFNLK